MGSCALIKIIVITHYRISNMIKNNVYRVNNMTPNENPTELKQKAFHVANQQSHIAFGMSWAL